MLIPVLALLGSRGYGAARILHQLEDLSRLNVAHCNSGTELVAALADPTVRAVLIFSDIRLSDLDFAGRPSPFGIERNTTILGAYEKKEDWPLVDFGFVREKMLLGPGVTLNFSRLVADRVRRGPYFQTPGMDIFAFSPRDPAKPLSYLVFWDCAYIQRTCLPESLYRASTDNLKRPVELPGYQLADRAPQWEPCEAAASAQALRRCWPKLGVYEDIATYGSDLLGPADKPTVNNYVVWMVRVYYLCSTVMTEDCVRQKSLPGCYYFMFPRDTSNGTAGSGNSTHTEAERATAVAAATTPQTSASVTTLQRQSGLGGAAPSDGDGGGGGGGVRIPLAPLLGGLLGGIAGLAAIGAVLALAGTALVRRRRRRIERADDKGDSDGAANEQDGPPVQARRSAERTSDGAAAGADGVQLNPQDGDRRLLQPPAATPARFPRLWRHFLHPPGHPSDMAAFTSSSDATTTAAASCSIALCSTATAAGGGHAAGGVMRRRDNSVDDGGPSSGSCGFHVTVSGGYGNDVENAGMGNGGPAVLIGNDDVNVGNNGFGEWSNDGSGDDDEVAEPVTAHTPLQPHVNLGVGVASGGGGSRAGGGGGGGGGGGQVQLSSVVLGKGSFGRVVQGTYGGVQVAVKLIDSGLLERANAAAGGGGAAGLGRGEEAALAAPADGCCTLLHKSGKAVPPSPSQQPQPQPQPQTQKLIQVGGERRCQQEQQQQVEEGAAEVAAHSGAVEPPAAQPAAAGAAAAVGTATSRASLAQEVEVLARCRHPNIVRLLAANLEPPNACLVMELMDTSLDKMLYGKQRNGSNGNDNGDNGCSDNNIGERVLMPLQMVLHVGLQIARALAYLHPTILHRDLKPANVLISQPHSEKPAVKLADFGLSRLNHTVLVTRNPEVGTAPYMAPETFDLENDIITDRVDIYALGVVLWEMLAGKRPWDGHNLFQLAYGVALHDARLPLDDIDEERCPVRLRHLILSCWDPQPARRPAAAEIVKDLASMLQEQQQGPARSDR